jgi:hypothetical protein
VSSFRNATDTTRATSAIAPSRIASLSRIAAVCPNRKLFSPPWSPLGSVWITDRNTMPMPNSTESTAPIAASSARRVQRSSDCTSAVATSGGRGRTDQQYGQRASRESEHRREQECDTHARERRVAQRVDEQRALAQAA